MINPATEDPTETIATGTSADVDASVAAAKAAFETWSVTVAALARFLAPALVTLIVYSHGAQSSREARIGRLRRTIARTLLLPRVGLVERANDTELADACDDRPNPGVSFWK